MMMTRQRRTRRRRRLNRPRNHHFPITLNERNTNKKIALFSQVYVCVRNNTFSLSLSVKAPDDTLPPSSLLNQLSTRTKAEMREKKSEEYNCIPRRRRRRERGNTKKSLGFTSLLGFRVATNEGNKEKKSGRKRLRVRWSIQK